MRKMALQISEKGQFSINVLENCVYTWKKNEIKYLLHTQHKKQFYGLKT